MKTNQSISYFLGWTGFVLFLFVFVLPADGIVRRDDVDDQEYIDFGADFPAVGELQDSNGIVGTGGLIVDPNKTNSEWVLTAAHIHEPTTFVLDGTTYGVSEFIQHDDWGGSEGPPGSEVEDDIALVRLDMPITGITPLQWHTSDVSSGLDVVSVGLGLKGTGLKGEESGSGGTKRAAENTISAVGMPQTVRTAFEYIFHDHNDANARDLEGMAVLYDSGGPVLADFGDGFEIVGVHSYVRNNGGNRGTYGDEVGSTRVPLYDEWILATIPEPNTLALLGSAIGLFSILSWRRKKRSS